METNKASLSDRGRQALVWPRKEKRKKGVCKHSFAIMSAPHYIFKKNENKRTKDVNREVGLPLLQRKRPTVSTHTYTSTSINKYICLYAESHRFIDLQKSEKHPTTAHNACTVGIRLTKMQMRGISA